MCYRNIRFFLICSITVLENIVESTKASLFGVPNEARSFHCKETHSLHLYILIYISIYIDITNCYCIEYFQSWVSTLTDLIVIVFQVLLCPRWNPISSSLAVVSKILDANLSLVTHLVYSFLSRSIPRPFREKIWKQFFSRTGCD